MGRNKEAQEHVQPSQRGPFNTRTQEYLLASKLKGREEKKSRLADGGYHPPLSPIDHARHASPVMPEADHLFIFSVDRFGCTIILTRRCADQILQARARAIDL